jgi:hypothetical protein
MAWLAARITSELTKPDRPKAAPARKPRAAPKRAGGSRA